MSNALRIVVVEPDTARAALIVDGLRGTGGHEIHVVAEPGQLARCIAQADPDIVLIDIADPSRDTLEGLTMASGPLERPVAMFVDRSADGLAKAAIEAGVSAYVVDGLRPERLAPVLDAAMARFQMFSQMRNELATTRRALEERKTIDRAKGLLMKARGIDEGEAYALLRRAAMDRNKRLAEVADALVTTAGLLS